MSAQDQSIGQELVRIIRAEIRAYDERKEEAVRLRKVADEAVTKADQAAKAARESTPDPIHAAFVGDLNAQSLDALFRLQQHQQHQQHSHVDFTIGNRSVERGVVQRANDELLRNQKQSAERTTAWTPRGTGENPPRRRWWQRKKR